MSKAEKVFWGVLLFLAGMMVGALVYALLTPPKKVEKCEETGRSTQVVGDNVYYTYLPELNKCK